MPETPANNELLIRILERLDQLDQKFTGEIQAVNTRLGQLDEKFTGEIQAARKEAREFHNASKESIGHLQRVVENEARHRVAFEQKMDRRWDEQQRLWLEIWDGIRRTMQKDDQRMLKDEEILARLEKEIDEFKKDKVVKDAISKDLQQRISKLETSQHLAN
jgi:hypothetical protein